MTNNKLKVGRYVVDSIEDNRNQTVIYIHKRTPMSTQEITVDYMKKDKKLSGTIIKYGGWYDVTDHDISAADLLNIFRVVIELHELKDIDITIDMIKEMFANANDDIE